MLRGLLEQRLLTEKTSWRRYGLNTCASLAGWPEPGGAAAAPDSAGAGGRDQDAAGGAEGKGDGGREAGARRGLRGSKLERARRMAAPQVRTGARCYRCGFGGRAVNPLSFSSQGLCQFKPDANDCHAKPTAGH